MMKNSDTWNIRRLVDDSFGPSSKQNSVIYCRLTDFKCETRSELHCPIWGKWGHKKSKKLPHKNRLSSEYYLVVASMYSAAQLKLSSTTQRWYGVRLSFFYARTSEISNTAIWTWVMETLRVGRQNFRNLHLTRYDCPFI